jgi:hypothetical protein
MKEGREWRMYGAGKWKQALHHLAPRLCFFDSICTGSVSPKIYLGYLKVYNSWQPPQRFQMLKGYRFGMANGSSLIHLSAPQRHATVSSSLIA